jgi:hypothetical protein
MLFRKQNSGMEYATRSSDDRGVDLSASDLVAPTLGLLFDCVCAEGEVAHEKQMGIPDGRRN